MLILMQLMLQRKSLNLTKNVTIVNDSYSNIKENLEKLGD